jgi:hypothetical protein
VPVGRPDLLLQQVVSEVEQRVDVIFSCWVVPTRELPLIRDRHNPRPPTDLAISLQDQDLLHSASRNEHLRLVLADDAKLLARFAEEIILKAGVV